jgi:hypothetical protein
MMLSKTIRRAICSLCKRVADLQGLYFDFYYMENVAADAVLLSRLGRYRTYLQRFSDPEANALLASIDARTPWKR